MKFQLGSISEREIEIPLSGSVSDHENVYTMIVGRNATGKSRLLAKLTNHFLFRKSAPWQEIAVSDSSSQIPLQIVVSSNSRFDKFPDPRRTSREQAIPYHYLAGGAREFNPYSVLSLAFERMLNVVDESSQKIDEFFQILGHAGFLPSCTFEVRKTILADLQVKKVGDSDSTRAVLGGMQERLDLDVPFDVSAIDNLMRGNRSAAIRLDVHGGWSGDINYVDLQLYLPQLIRAGLLKIERLILFDIKTKNKVPFHQASSGQQCMLLMFLGLAGVMRNGSLVCIDEPEISLHPKWQAEFIGLLQRIFSSYKGCHFLIATHSPQVVSGLTSQNGFVVDLETRELTRSNEYAKKSADFQLSEIFHEPGFRNEYLIRILLVILSKLSKREGLTESDRQKIRDLELLKNRLDEDDPVRHLLAQVKVLS